MTGEILKTFLVGLGFSVSDSDLKKFNKALDSAALQVSALYGSVNLAAAGIVKGITDISEGFEQMGYEYRIIAPTINKAIVLRRELLKAYSTAGINIREVVLQSVKLNMSIAKTKFALEAIYKSVGARFFTLLTEQSDLFRNKLYANLPKIQALLEKFIKIIFKALDVVTTLASRAWSILTRVYDFFVKLDKATNGWSTNLIAVAAAWKFLNLSFLVTPLGMILALGVAVLALYDDFETFKAGGQSLINWGSDTVKIITAVITIMGGLTAAFYAIQIALALANWRLVTYAILMNAVAIANALAAAPLYVIIAAVGALVAILGLADAKWKIFGGHLSGGLSAVGSKILGFSNSVNPQALQNNPVGASLGNPLGANAQLSNTNQQVTQQTNINVQGSADANSIGKSVANEQNRVNFDMARNMKGATR